MSPTSFTILTICRGLPASNKTGWAQEQVHRNPGTTVRVNRDDLRLANFGVHVLTGPDCNKDESLLTKIHLKIVEQFLIAKKNVIVDDTNLSMRAIDNLYNLATRFDGNVQIRFQDFEITVKESILRDEKRGRDGGRSVGADAIREISKRHLYGGSELPTLDAKYYARIDAPKRAIQDDTLPAAWIFDLDGTLAELGTDRSYYDWHRVDEDAPIEHAIALLKVLKDTGNRVIIVTGRDAKCGPETREWLSVWDIPYHDLLMRPVGDSRPDEIVKEDIYENMIAGKYFVAGVLDDRNKVSDMWRAKGLFVAQVNPGLF